MKSQEQPFVLYKVVERKWVEAHHHLLQKNPEDDDVCQDFVGVLSPSFELEPELQVA